MLIKEKTEFLQKCKAIWNNDIIKIVFINVFYFLMFVVLMSDGKLQSGITAN